MTISLQTLPLALPVIAFRYCKRISLLMCLLLSVDSTSSSYSSYSGRCLTPQNRIEMVSAPLTVKWNKVCAGRVAAVGFPTRIFDRTFKVEVPCLIGDATFKEMQTSMSLDYPRLLLLGYCPEYAGEVRGKLYNAYVSLDLERVDIDEGSVSRNTRTNTGSEVSLEGSSTLVNTISSAASSSDTESHNPLQGLRIVLCNSRHHEGPRPINAYTYRTTE